jgi:hypothetical protein
MKNHGIKTVSGIPFEELPEFLKARIEHMLEWLADHPKAERRFDWKISLLTGVPTQNFLQSFENRGIELPAGYLKNISWYSELTRRLEARGPAAKCQAACLHPGLSVRFGVSVRVSL